MFINQHLLDPLVLAANGNQAASHSILGHGTGFHKLQKIVRPAGFRTDTRHLESAERLSFHDGARASAVEVEIADPEFPTASLKVLGAAAENSTG